MLPAILQQTHQWVAAHLPSGGTAVDATLGNGHDIRFLAEYVGDTGRVFGFDIQEEAIRRTQLRLEQASLHERTTLIHDGHEHMKDHLYNRHVLHIDAVMFNLGYLPNGDKTITTTAASTLDAMRQAVDLLNPGGILTAVLYTGHPGGHEEAEQVLAWMKQLDTDYQAVQYQILNRDHAPILTAVYKG